MGKKTNCFLFYKNKNSFYILEKIKKCFSLVSTFCFVLKGDMFLCAFSFFLFFFHRKFVLTHFDTSFFLSLHCFHSKRPSQHFPFQNVFFASIFPLVFPKSTCSLFCLSVFSRCFLFAALLKFLFSLSFVVSLFSQSKTLSQNFCFVSLYTSGKLSFSVFFYFTLKNNFVCSLFCWAFFLHFVCPCFVFCLCLEKLFLVFFVTLLDGFLFRSYFI